MGEVGNRKKIKVAHRINIDGMDTTTLNYEIAKCYYDSLIELNPEWDFMGIYTENPEFEKYSIGFDDKETEVERMAKVEAPKKLRVAVYMRIGGSTVPPFAVEVKTTYYKDFVGKNPDWEFAGIYADVGAEMRHRPELKRLVNDCEAGQVDLIVTKCLTRFSRNIVEVMKTVRQLRYLKHPVGVYFENENLNTLANDKFVMLSLFEAMAIEESERKHEYLPCSQILRKARQKKSIKKPEE